MRSFLSYVNGEDLAGSGWVHVLAARAQLDDPRGAIALKRDLDGASGPGVDEPPAAGADDPRVIGRMALTTPQQRAGALRAARLAQSEWSRVPLAERLAFGRACHQALSERAGEFVDALVADGHPRRLAEWEVSGVLQSCSDETLHLIRTMAERTDRIGQREVRLVRKPDGVVCVSPPRNASASNSLLGLGALIAGNAIVVQAPRSCPLGVAWVWREVIAPVLREFGAPAGVLNIVCGAPQELMQEWIASPDVDDIMFIGGSSVGIGVGQRCMTAGKKPILELAGNDGVLVWPDADLSLAARALAECFYGSGQICMVPKYALVHPEVADELIDLLVKEVAEIRSGYPEDPETVLSPVLKTAEFAEVLDEAIAAGGVLGCGGGRIDLRGLPDPGGPFVQPTVLRVDGLAEAEDLRAVRTETFYPLLPIVVPRPGPESALQACLDFMDRNPYGLRNSLWSDDPAVVAQFCDHLSNGGILKVNDSHIGFVPGMPTHGGTGLSGGPLGESHLPSLRTTHLQAISIATGVSPRAAVFDMPRAAERVVQHALSPSGGE